MLPLKKKKANCYSWICCSKLHRCSFASVKSVAQSQAFLVQKTWWRLQKKSYWKSVFQMQLQPSVSWLCNIRALAQAVVNVFIIHICEICIEFSFRSVLGNGRFVNGKISLAVWGSIYSSLSMFILNKHFLAEHILLCTSWEGRVCLNKTCNCTLTKKALQCR